MVAVGWRKRGGSKPIKFTKEKTMNEQIRELAKQAEEEVKAEYEDESRRNSRLYNEIFLLKFAELIVKECLSKVAQRNYLGWSFGELLPWYTTLPQRKPLTRERLVEMAEAQCGLERTFEDWVELFAREIEAAHGIKEMEKNNAR